MMPPTRRDFLAASAAALTSAYLRPALLAAAAVPANFTMIRRDVGCFTMRGGTVGYLINEAGVVVVDSQFPAEARALIAGLQERSGGRPVAALINTHHHGDHTGGNGEFRGVARHVVAHAQAAAHMRQPPGAAAPAADSEQLYPDTTFTASWAADVGAERVVARWHGRAHTSGDAVVTFERANVAHMGDLMFHRRHPVVDRAAGATLRGWMSVLERGVADHDADTIFIFGHAAAEAPITGTAADLMRFRDYLEALLGFVAAHLRAGRGRDDILALRDPLPGFEEYGRFGQPGPRDPLTCAYEELTSASGS